MCPHTFMETTSKSWPIASQLHGVDCPVGRSVMEPYPLSNFKILLLVKYEILQPWKKRKQPHPFVRTCWEPHKFPIKRAPIIMKIPSSAIDQQSEGRKELQAWKTERTSQSSARPRVHGRAWTRSRSPQSNDHCHALTGGSPDKCGPPRKSRSARTIRTARTCNGAALTPSHVALC